MNRKRLPRNWHNLTSRQRAKHEHRICVKPHCRNRPERHGCGTFLLTCATCRHRDYALRNPIKIKFLNLKKSANKRKIPFSVSWDRFKELAESSGYDRFVSEKDARTLSVNRVPEGAPYSDGTIEIIPLGENSRLAAEYRALIRKGYVGALQIGGRPNA